MSQGRLAVLTSTSQPQIDRLEKGERRLTIDWIARIAAALTIPPAALLADTPLPPELPPAPQQPPPSPLHFAESAALPRDVPVLGTAQGGDDGVFLLNMTGSPIDWARRPLALAGMTSVFAIYVEGDSMAPWRQSGELVFAQDGRTPAPGNHVIIVTQAPVADAPQRARIKKLLRRTASQIELEQYNPPGTILIPAEQVVRLYRVLEWSEVLGLYPRPMACKRHVARLPQQAFTFPRELSAMMSLDLSEG